jgi:hypothetical protein
MCRETAGSLDASTLPPTRPGAVGRRIGHREQNDAAMPHIGHAALELARLAVVRSFHLGHMMEELVLTSDARARGHLDPLAIESARVLDAA